MKYINLSIDPLLKFIKEILQHPTTLHSNYNGCTTESWQSDREEMCSPILHLALGRIERGHRTTLMAHENFKEFVEGYGVEFHSLEGNVEDMLHTKEALKVLKSGCILAFAKYLQKNSENQGGRQPRIRTMGVLKQMCWWRVCWPYPGFTASRKKQESAGRLCS